MNERIFEHERCLVIGNGFDLNLGFPTSYKNFLDSDEWASLVNVNNQPEGLIRFIHKQSVEYNWSDLEMIVLKYAKLFKANETCVELIYEEYISLCDAIDKYLSRVFNETRPSEFCFARSFLKRYLLDSNDNPILSFNYTSLDRIAKHYNTINAPRTTFVHGTLDDKSSIFGVECENFNDISHHLSFLIKSNSFDYHSTNVDGNLLRSKKVYFFGHSLNDIDKEYFKPFLVECTKRKLGRSIVFVTKDDSSDRSIRDNIRRMNVSVLRLYQNCDIKFLHIDSIKPDQYDAALEDIW